MIFKSTSPLATLISQQMQVVFALDSQWYQPLKLHNTITFSPLNTNHLYHGKIIYLSPVQGMDNHQFELRANLVGKKLHSGLFGKVTITIKRHHPVIVIRNRYLYANSLHYFVYLVENGTIKVQPVTPQIFYRNGLVSITDGLAKGAQLVISDPTYLQTGEKVKIASKSNR